MREKIHSDVHELNEVKERFKEELQDEVKKFHTYTEKYKNLNLELIEQE